MSEQLDYKLIDTKRRIEEKFLIPRTHIKKIEKEVSNFCTSDENSKDGSYSVSSVYFDTKDLRYYRQKKDGLISRRKYRLRYYNKKIENIKFEIKHKSSNISWKNVLDVKDSELHKKTPEELVYSLAKKVKDSRFIQSVKDLSLVPTIYIEFERTAYFEKKNNIRVTFDKSLKFNGLVNRKLNRIKYSNILEGDNSIVVELKYDSNYCPKWLSFLRQSMSEYSQSYSKYERSIDQYLQRGL